MYCAALAAVSSKEIVFLCALDRCVVLLAGFGRVTFVRAEFFFFLQRCLVLDISSYFVCELRPASRRAGLRWIPSMLRPPQRSAHSLCCSPFLGSTTASEALDDHDCFGSTMTVLDQP